MLGIESYELMKKKYGRVASWAVWRPAGDTVKSNTDNMDWVNDNDLLDTLGTGFVFVGLNGSSTHRPSPGTQRRGAWRNFHSGDNRRQNDFKLRFALSGTRYWGSYITDLIKYYPEVDSSKVKVCLRENPKMITKNVSAFEKEISFLGEKPVLVALGVTVYKLLVKHLEGEYNIVKVKHYAAYIRKETYREEVLKTLDKIR